MRRNPKAPKQPTEPDLAPRPRLVNRDVVEGLPTKLLMALRTEISLELDRRKQQERQAL
ncbi:MAG TPA: hypothetical protein VJ570_07680 [Holophagaceae bacterium]|nr:hypothetical protein [Holophagaceae bacterium]